jgi:hypothetical protein
MSPLLSRILFTTLTIVVFVGILMMFFLGLNIHQIGLSIVSALLGVGISVFIYHDAIYYLNYFKKK